MEFSDISHRAANAYLAALLEGDRAGARLALDQALGDGVQPMAVYLSVLVPTQRRVGELWLDGKLSIAGEHLATEITSVEMEYLRARAPRKPALGKRAMVAIAPGERHALGGRIVADFLFVDGWEVDFLGADVPASELAAFVQDRKPDVLAISVVLAHNLGRAAEAARAVREAVPDIPIMLGGTAIRDQLHAEELGANGYAADASDAVRIARVLAGLGSAATLDQLLKDLGNRIQARRRLMNWNQQALADASGLDRTYVSALENGRQNLTVGALVKIAQALQLAPGDLLGD